MVHFDKWINYIIIYYVNHISLYIYKYYHIRIVHFIRKSFHSDHNIYRDVSINGFIYSIVVTMNFHLTSTQLKLGLQALRITITHTSYLRTSKIKQTHN